jgi:xanthine dehydrogenase accessory factor
MLLDSAGRATGRIEPALLEAAGRRRAAELLRAAATAPAPAVERVQVGAEQWLLYVEAHFPPERLLVVGAGHIAVPLARLGALLDFRVTVLDDRAEFATAARFDTAVAVRRADFERDPFEGVQIDERTYIALVTRGHRWDFDCLQRVLAAPVRPRYIGMVGSRRRVRAAFHALRTAGFDRTALARIHAPIGLEIGAETPVEIAVSIAAELVAVRRGRAADSISARERVVERFMQDADAE